MVTNTTNTVHAVCESPALHEIHRGTIRAHHAKAGYDYPTIHLPVAFSTLIGMSTHVYHTVHDGALAFLVVVSSASKTARMRAQTLPSDGVNVARKLSHNKAFVPVVFKCVLSRSASNKRLCEVFAAIGKSPEFNKARL